MNSLSDNTQSNNQMIPLPKGVLLQSILVGFFMDIKCINYILNSYGFDENSSIMTLLYIATIAAIFLVGFINNTYKKIGSSALLILVYIALSYFITVSFGGVPLVSLPHLAVFTISAFLIPFVSQIDARITLRAIMFYPILGINHLSEIFVFTVDWNEWISMGLSYAFYVPIVATIVYLAVYFMKESRKQKVITLLLAAVNMVYLFMIFQFGSRGPITLLLMLIATLFVVRPSDYTGLKVKKGSLFLGIIIGVLCVLFFDQILLSIDTFLGSFGVSSHVITKFINLSQEGDIAHNRTEIMDLALNGFWNSPIWGNGLDCFDHNTRMMYPHNFLLQILYDGGLLLLIILSYPVIKFFITKIHNCDTSTYAIVIFLLLSGVAGGLFSGDLWKLPLLWMFFGFVSSNNLIYNKYE